MFFTIDTNLFEKFLDLHIGLVFAQGIDNAGSDDAIMNSLRDQEATIKSQFTLETLSQDPNIDAWRKAYSLFGAKPKKYKCSVENLYRMILQGIELRHISKVVDIYNYISIKHIIPVGGDDLDHVDGNITLKLAKGDEPFVELNSDEIKHPKEGEVVYVDGKEVLCRRWNWRECNKSKMTETTKNILLVVEGIPPTTKEQIEIITQELKSLIEKYCGGTIKTFVLNKSKPQIEL